MPPIFFEGASSGSTGFHKRRPSAGGKGLASRCRKRKKTPRTGYPRWQRDGFIFEAISWIAARQACGERALLEDPHVSATSQGLDGLMIELAGDKSEVVSNDGFRG